jgi:xylitol oxidase
MRVGTIPRQSVGALLLLLVHHAACAASGGNGPHPQNWAGTVTYEHKIFNPSTVDEVVSILAQYRKVRVVGTKHSFNNITRISPSVPYDEGAYISTENLNSVLKCCRGERVVVQPGITYGDLGVYLRERNMAVYNMASLPHVTVGGAIMTGTHGSGQFSGNLASQVTRVKVVRSDGTTKEFFRGMPEFNHAVVSFGLVGVVVEIELDISPAFDIQQCIYTDLPSEVLLRNDFERAVSTAYSFSIFTTWSTSSIGKEMLTSFWAKYKLSKGRKGTDEVDDSFECPTLFDQPASTVKVHPLPGLDAEASCSGPPGHGPSYVELPHFLMGATPSKGDELQSEYFVPIARYLGALHDMFKYASGSPRIADVLLVSELRFIGSDHFTMSPQGLLGSTMGFHFTWKKDPAKVAAVLKDVEQILMGTYNAVPHFGKVFLASGKDLEEKYGAERLREFQEFVLINDPRRTFVNDFLEQTLLQPTSNGQL